MPTHTDLSRREFTAACVAATAAAAFAAPEEKPLLRIGAMSDNHLHSTRPLTHQRTKACFELFRKFAVDVVADTGDISDLSETSEFVFFRKCFDEAFAGTATVPFFGVANHDYNYLPNTKRNDPAVIANASKLLGMASVNPSVEVKGYRFTNYFQNEKLEVLEENVRKACAASPAGRPVFVMTHVPATGTTTDTGYWSSPAIRNVLNRYPQVVNLTGHIHTSIKWDANVWQGEFTAISLGAHAKYSNEIDGEATIIDVFADRMEVRRFEAVSGREIRPDERWIIPLPLDPAHGPYRAETRRAKYPAPEFAAGWAAKYVQEADGCEGRLEFPPAEPRGHARRYHVAFETRGEDGAWKFIASANWMPPQTLDVPDVWKCPVEPGILDAGRPHRVTVTPVNSHGRKGKPGTLEFTAPANPMKALDAELTRVVRVQYDETEGAPEAQRDADGLYPKKRWQLCFMLPPALTDELLKHTRATFVVDLASEQPEIPNVFRVGAVHADGKGITCISHLGRVGGRLYSEGGTFQTNRLGWPVNVKRYVKPGDRLCFYISEGGKARFKVNSVRVFAG